MIKSGFLGNPQLDLVADASALINLNATRRAADIIRLLPHALVVTELANDELVRGSQYGYDDATQVKELINGGLARLAVLNDKALLVYESLVDGSASRTLDDGEAATISHAIDCGGIALIDERTARNLCRSSFPHLEVVTTAELIAHDIVRGRFGAAVQSDMMFLALRDAKMSVPSEHLPAVCAMVGPERARQCPCLPQAYRR